MCLPQQATMDIRKFFKWLFDQSCVLKYTLGSKPKDWDHDCESYNNFFSELSYNSDILIPYRNTDFYITCKPNIQYHNRPNFDKILREASGGEVLLMHVAVFEDTESTFGHSCLLMFDTRTRVQTFIDPCSFYGDDSISNAMCYNSLATGYCSWCCQRDDMKTPQHVFENITSPFQGTCGLVCVLLALAFIYHDAPMMKVIDEIAKLTPRDANAIMRKCVTWYEKMYIRDECFEIPAM